MLALSAALMTTPVLLMCDEPSLGHAPTVVGQLRDVLRAIHRRGTTIVIVEQSVNVALQLAQRAVFMEKGEVRFEGPTSELLERPDILRSVFIAGAAGVSGNGKVAAEEKKAERKAKARPEVKAREAVAEDAAVMLQCGEVTKRLGGSTAVDDVGLGPREGE